MRENRASERVKSTWMFSRDSTGRYRRLMSATEAVMVPTVSVGSVWEMMSQPPAK